MNQHEQCSLDALLFLSYRVKLDDDSFFFLGEELNLEQFYFFVLSVEWFWKPSSILYWEQKQAPLAVLLHAIFRGSRSACSPVSCTLYDVRQ